MDIHLPVAHLQLQPILAIIVGILVLAMPQRLNFILAAYLMLIGVLGLGLFR